MEPHVAPRQRKPFSRKGLGGIVAINAVLLGLLALVTFSPPIGAQGFRARGDYIAVTGTAPGFDPAVICIVDQTNQQLIGLTFDPNTRQLTGVGARDLARDAAQFSAARN